MENWPSVLFDDQDRPLMTFNEGKYKLHEIISWCAAYTCNYIVSKTESDGFVFAYATNDTVVLLLSIFSPFFIFWAKCQAIIIYGKNRSTTV